MGERQLLCNMDEARVSGAHAMCMEITKLNRQQPLNVVLQMHEDSLVGSKLLALAMPQLIGQFPG